jgi:membrane protein YdbS with pleckstrin-like domain
MVRSRALRDLGAEERVLLVARRHPLVLLRAALPGLASLLALGAVTPALRTLGGPAVASVAGALAALVLLWLLWTWADWRADVLTLTDRRVLWVERTPFLSERRWEAPLDAMQNVAAVSGGPVGKLLRCGDVILDTASRGVQRLHGIRRAPAVATAILDAQGYAARRGNRLDRLRVSMGLAPRAADPGREPAGTRVWRRHWWILARALALPAALLVGGALLSSVLGIRLVLFAAAGLALLRAAWVADDWRNDEVIATADRIIQTRRSPLTLHEETWQASLDKVQDIGYALPNPLAQLLNYGTVTVTTAGEAVDFALSGVPRPRDLCADLNARLQARRGRAKREMLAEVEQTVLAVLRSKGL